jgi:hypothetical protein
MMRVAPLSVSCLAAAVASVALPVLPGCQCDDGVAVIPGDVVGRACDPVSGQGLPSTPLTLVAGAQTYEALTAVDGSYRFARVFPGAVTLHVPDANTGIDRTFPVDVVSQQITTITDTACRGEPVLPGEGGVDGQVCNRHTGALVTDADVIVATVDQVFRTSTDAEGRFLLSPLPDGEHVLTVQGEGFQRSFAIEIDGALTHLELGEHCVDTDLTQGTLSGSLCDPNDPTGALVGATVRATDASGTVVTDVTDTNGEFFLNALAPGEATVTVVRDPDVNNLYGIDVIAGADNTVVRELSCNEDATCSYEVVGSPVIDQRPVDILFVVDDSGSMDDDNEAVQNNINAFSSSIAAAGVDHRVVLVGTTNVPAPLGGSAEFRQIDTSVDSNDPLIELVDNYPLYRNHLREDAVKHFIVITDDESDMSASEFRSTVQTWPGFGSWTLHSIVAFGSDPENGCDTGAAYGHQYMNLSSATGGVTSPICDANYAEVFDAVVAAVTTVTLPCTLPIDAPAGLTTDPARLEVTYEGTTLPVRGTCNGPGWRFDPVAESVVACPETCAALAEDDGSGVISASVGCFED